MLLIDLSVPRNIEEEIKNIEQEISEKSIRSLKEVVKELKFE